MNDGAGETQRQKQVEEEMKGNLGNGENVCFSQNKDDWRTPQKLFDDLNAEFNFGLDAAADKNNSKCGARYCDKIGNALTVDWKYHSQGLPIFLNPPYGDNKKFIEKAYKESQNGATVVCLIPSRTDTQWWHDYVMKSEEIRFFRGRLYFDDAIWPAPFPSCIVVFKNRDSAMPRLSVCDARKYRNYTNKNIQREPPP